MRPQKIQDKDLFSGLLDVFRSKGYEGASLNELAIGCGLQKASLYHRFPKGKKEIASSVLNYVTESIENHIYKILVNTKVPISDRLSSVLENISYFYKGGETTCILRSMSLDFGMELFHTEIRQGMQKWIDGFTFIGEELGYSKEIALEKANETFIKVQGSLILAKAMGQSYLFEDALEKIKILYED